MGYSIAFQDKPIERCFSFWDDSSTRALTLTEPTQYYAIAYSLVLAVFFRPPRVSMHCINMQCALQSGRSFSLLVTVKKAVPD